MRKQVCNSIARTQYAAGIQDEVAPPLTAPVHVINRADLRTAPGDKRTYNVRYRVTPNNLSAEARRAMVESVYPMIHSAAKKFRRVAQKLCLQHTYRDLFQAGAYGAAYAARIWDETKGAKYSTIAFNWIRAKIEEVINHERPLGARHSKQRTILRTDSLNAPTSFRGDFGDTLADHKTVASWDDSDWDWIFAPLTLAEREACILVFRFGLKITVTAKTLGITREAVNQRIKKATPYLRERLLSGGFLESIE